jgi:hypothetical protein
MTTNKLNPMALGLSLGIMWGVSMLIMGLVAYYFMFGTPFVTAMGGIYVGYEPSITGSIIGGVIGFIDAFIGGLMIAWLYNCFSGCCSSKK